MSPFAAARVAAIAAAVVVPPAIARAGTPVWRADAEAAAEVDSNVNRAEEGGAGAPRGAALARVAGSVEGAGQFRGTRWGARTGTDVRVVGDPDLVGENLAAVSGELRGDRELADRPVRVGARVGAYDVLGLGAEPSRGMQWIFGEAALGLHDGDRRATLSVGARDFRYRLERGDAEALSLAWRGPTVGLGATTVVWQGDDADPSAVDVVTGYRLELRGYRSGAFADVCGPDEPATNACLAAVEQRRSDMNHRLHAGVTYSGERIYAAEYELTVNDSSSHRESWTHHRVTLTATASLPLGLFATARGSVQVERYPDRLVIPDDSQQQNATTIDDDNRSSLSLRLARRLGQHWTAEARWSFWTDAFADDELRFRRHLIALGDHLALVRPVTRGSLSLPRALDLWYPAAMRVLAVVVLACVALLGCGASDGDCDKACRNYFTLHYWEEANAEIASAPVAERDALRTRKLAELADRANKGIVLCVKQCKTAATKEQVACLLGATTSAAAKACLATE